MRTGIAKLKEKFLTEYPNRIELGVAFLALFLIFSTMFYGDNFGMFLTYFWTNEGLFSGTGLDMLGSNQLPYGLMHQWICEIWVLPVNLLYHLFKFDFNSPMAILWYKLIIPIFLLLCMREMSNIARIMQVQKKHIMWMHFLFITSVLVTLPVFHIAQTDVLYLFFMLRGFRALLQNDTKKFLVYYAISGSFKMISLFVFIPLVLMKEKRILFIIRNMICGCIIVPLQHVWYRVIQALNGAFFYKDLSTQYTQHTQQAETVVESVEETQETITGFYSHFYNKILYFEFPAVRKGYVASLLVFLFVLLCIWCYMQKTEDTHEWRLKCIYFSTASLLLFFVMSSPSPYWIVILYPFLFLLIYANNKRLRINLLLEKAFTMTMFIVYVMNTFWVYGGAKSFDWLFLTKWGIVPTGHELQGGPNIAGYLEKIYVDKFMPVITAVCLACAIGIIWVNWPKLQYDEELTEEYEKGLHHGFGIFNIVFLLMWYVVNVVLISRY